MKGSLDVERMLVVVICDLPLGLLQKLIGVFAVFFANASCGERQSVTGTHNNE
jgi:hypothetical protein